MSLVPKRVTLAKVPKSVAREVGSSNLMSLMSINRIQNAKHVGLVGIHAVADLSRDEEQLAAMVPHAIHRLSPIVDRVAMVVLMEVTRMGGEL